MIHCKVCFVNIIKPNTQQATLQSPQELYKKQSYWDEQRTTYNTYRRLWWQKLKPKAKKQKCTWDMQTFGPNAKILRTDSMEKITVKDMLR